MNTPTEITQCCDTDLNTASFDYYSGIAYAKENNLKQTTDFADVRKGTHFIVMCGDVMIKVEPTDFPEMKRRIF